MCLEARGFFGRKGVRCEEIKVFKEARGFLQGARWCVCRRGDVLGGEGSVDWQGGTLGGQGSAFVD